MGKRASRKPYVLGALTECVLEAVPLRDFVRQDVLHPLDGAQAHGVRLLDTPTAIKGRSPVGDGEASALTGSVLRVELDEDVVEAVFALFSE